jgi:dihydrofolate reductase
MKVTLYMAITANGYIATEAGDSSFTSEADGRKLADLAKKIGNIVCGRGTYDALVKEEQFPMPGTLNIVMTSEPPQVEPLENVLFFTESPEEVIAELEKRGFKEALIAGGGALNGSFLTDGLVDEMYLTVEPLLLSSGVHLFEHADFRRDLELIGTEKLSENEIQLHYSVVK